MRVGISTNDLRFGGAERQRVSLGNELCAKGHDATLLCLKAGGPLEREVGVLLRTEFARGIKRGSPRQFDVLLTGTTNTEMVFGYVSRFLRRTAKVWVVAIHNPAGPNAPRIARVARSLLGAADLTIALTPNHRRNISKYWRHEAGAIISNGIDVQRYEMIREERRREQHFKYDVGFVGRISNHHKGLDRLLDGLARPAASRLTALIGGDGPDLEYLKTYAAERGLSGRVTFAGSVEAGEVYRNAAVLAVLSRYEAQPLVLLEAQASAIPVLISKEVGQTNHAAGQITVPIEPDALAIGLAECASQAALSDPIPIDYPSSAADMAAIYADAFERLLDANCSRGAVARTRALLTSGWQRACK